MVKEFNPETHDKLIDEMMNAANTPTMKALVDKVYRPYHEYLHDTIIPQTAISGNVSEVCNAMVNLVSLMIITVTETAQLGEPDYEGVLEFYNRFQREIAHLLNRKIVADFGVATEVTHANKSTQH